MCKFQGVAENSNRDRLTFFFMNPNWAGSLEAAEKALTATVKADKFYQENGPWWVVRYDVSA